MIVLDDLANVAKSRVAAVSNFTAASPGGLWFGRGPETPSAYPYTVLTINPESVENFSGSAYLCSFTLKFAGYVQIGEAGNITPMPTTALGAALNESFATIAAQSAIGNISLRNTGEKILSSMANNLGAGGGQLNPDGLYAKEMRAGQDVFVCGLAVEWLCQGNRDKG